MTLQDLIKSEADQCVKCALCAPHCPTYQATRDEGDSPRGRIALMQALATAQLPPGGRLGYHLDRCLACRACERVCPSRVRYGRLIDAARALEAPRRRPGRLARWLRDTVIPDRRRLGRVARLLRLYQASGLRGLARSFGLLRLAGVRRLDGLLPPTIPAAPRWRGWYPPAGAQRGAVALFTGCVGGVLERAALDDAIRVLNACGYGVHVPADQTCCGALHLHDGEPARAAEFGRRNLAAFNALAGDPAPGEGGTRIEAVLYTSSGCGTTLAEYGDWPAGGDVTPPGRFAVPVLDLCTFLARDGRLDGLPFAPLDLTAAVHDPCTLKNVVRAAEAPYRLLGHVPGLRTVSLPGPGHCCGAAGSYLLQQPEMADRLRAGRVTAFRDTGAEILLTSNIGCALHLASGLREDTPGIEVLHPVTLLARSLDAGRN